MKMNQRKRKLSDAKEETQKGQQRRFQTRWSTLKRKAKILGTLCQGQVCMLTSRSNGKLDHWPNAAATKEIATKYLETRNVGAFLHKTLSLSDFPKIKKKKNAVDDSGRDFQVFNVEEFNKFSTDALLELSDFLHRKVESADSTLLAKGTVLNSMYMNDQESRNFCIAGSFGQSNNNNIGYNIFPLLLGSSDCSNNSYEESYGSAARNCRPSLISNAKSIGFEGFENNSMHQQSGRNMKGGFEGTDHPSQIDPSLISSAESISFDGFENSTTHQKNGQNMNQHQFHVNEVPNYYQTHYAHDQHQLQSHVYEGVSHYGHDDQSTMPQQSRQNVDSVGGTYDLSQLDESHFDEVSIYPSHYGHYQSTMDDFEATDYQPQLDQHQYQYHQFHYGHDA